MFKRESNIILVTDGILDQKLKFLFKSYVHLTCLSYDCPGSLPFGGYLKIYGFVSVPTERVPSIKTRVNNFSIN